jgi:hypothetical protein
MNPSNSSNPVIIDPTHYDGWDDLILRHPDYSFFHCLAWAKVLRESYGYTPLYFTVLEEDRIKALIPVMEVDSLLTGKRGVSLPFTDYCEPMIEGNVRFQDFLDHVIEYGQGRGWRTLELRSGNNLLPSAPPSMTYLRHVLDLSQGEKQVFLNFRDSTRRNAKKAIKEGVEVKIDHSLESVKEFYRLNGITRQDHGLPPQPFSFFKKIYDHIISKNLGMVVLASLDQVNVAGAIYLHFGAKAVYKYGASDKNFQNLRANNLVMWEAIKWYSQAGYKRFCFGRTEPENQGLIQFKSGWGTTEQPIHYYRYDLRKGFFVSGSPKVTGFHNKIFRNIPVPVLNRIGTILYKHMG